MKISFKMTRQIPRKRNSPKIRQERKNYANWYTNLPINMRYQKMIFIDKSHFSLHMLRSHKRARIGKTSNPVLTNSREPNITIIIAVSAKNVCYCKALTNLVFIFLLRG